MMRCRRYINIYSKEESIAKSKKGAVIIDVRKDVRYNKIERR